MALSSWQPKTIMLTTIKILIFRKEVLFILSQASEETLKKFGAVLKEGK